jgi:sec-independent protein translocase protein TatA
MLSNFAILDFGMPELIIIFAIVLLLFGGKKLPQLSKSLGESMKNIREGMSDATGAKEDLKKTALSIKQDLSVKPDVAAPVSTSTPAPEQSN